MLTLKKYEKPPPRYFQDFSDKVIARIQAAEEARSRPWWERLGFNLVLRPAFAGAMGLMLSVGVVAGVLVANPPDQNGPLPRVEQPALVQSSRSVMHIEEIPSSTTPVATTLAGATPSATWP